MGPRPWPSPPSTQGRPIRLPMRPKGRSRNPRLDRLDCRSTIGTKASQQDPKVVQLGQGGRCPKVRHPTHLEANREALQVQEQGAKDPTPHHSSTTPAQARPEGRRSKPN